MRPMPYVPCYLEDDFVEKVEAKMREQAKIMTAVEYRVARATLDAMHKEIDDANAEGRPVPVFAGIVELHKRTHAFERVLKPRYPKQKK